jgi:uncharacterized protein (DUF433 family)
MDYEDVITLEAGKRFGKPFIRGLRIAVQDVRKYLASGMTEADIVAGFPERTVENIRACLAFAADWERKMVSVSAATPRQGQIPRTLTPAPPPPAPPPSPQSAPAGLRAGSFNSSLTRECSPAVRAGILILLRDGKSPGRFTGRTGAVEQGRAIDIPFSLTGALADGALDGAGSTA